MIWNPMSDATGVFINKELYRFHIVQYLKFNHNVDQTWFCF